MRCRVDEFSRTRSRQLVPAEVFTGTGSVGFFAESTITCTTKATPSGPANVSVCMSAPDDDGNTVFYGGAPNMTTFLFLNCPVGSARTRKALLPMPSRNDGSVRHHRGRVQPRLHQLHAGAVCLADHGRVRGVPAAFLLQRLVRAIVHPVSAGRGHRRRWLHQVWTVSIPLVRRQR